MELTLEQKRALAIASARKRLAEAQAAAGGAPKPQTNLVEQAGTGTSEGIASMLGLPVDLVTRVINAATGRVGLPQIENPVGGSESIERLLSPFMSDAEPQTAAQRIGRRVGQDVGAGAVAGPVAGARTVAGLGVNAAADVASGLAGGATREVTDNPIADTVASLAAGAAVPGATAFLRRPPAPSIDDLRRQEGALYDRVRDSDVRLSPDQAQELQGNVSARMHDEGMFPPADTQATGAVSRLYEMPDRTPDGRPSLQDVEDVRQHINARVVGSGTDVESKVLGPAMKREIDDYLRGVAEKDPDAAPDIEAGFRAHRTTQRRAKAEEVEREFQSAEWRAGTTGLGGNDINAVRQNIRRILDDPERARGYTPDERAQMRRIVEGTKATNAARFVGQLSPQRSPWLTIAQSGGAAYTSNPALMAPAGIGIVAQAIGEALTRRQIKDLSAMVRSGKPLERALTDGERAVLAALLANQGRAELLASR